MAGKKPLLLLTRPRAASDRFIRMLPEAVRDGLDLCLSPLIEIETIAASADLGGFGGVIFTSANAVAAAQALGLPAGLPAHCVGQATTRAARAANWQAQTCGETAQQLVAHLERHRPETPLLHLSGRHTRVDLASELSDAGIATQNRPIYDQPLRPVSQEALDLVARAQAVIAPVFSPRTGAQLARQLPETGHVHALAMSEAVAKSLETRRWASLCISAAPTAASLARDIVALMNRLTRVEGNPRAQ